MELLSASLEQKEETLEHLKKDIIDVFLMGVIEVTKRATEYPYVMQNFSSR